MCSLPNSSTFPVNSTTSADGGIICARRRYAFVYNPLERISFDSEQKKSFNDISSTIMSMAHNCVEQLIVCSCTWHKVVDLETGRKIREIYEQDGFVTSISWNPTNPNVFASVGTDSTIRTWDIRAHPAQTLQLRRHRRYKCVAYSPDSNMLGFAGDLVELVDLTNPRNTIQLAAPSPVINLRFNPVEYLLATSGEDRVVRFWDVDTSECVSQSLPSTAPMKDMEFDEQGSLLIASTGTEINAFCWEPFQLFGTIDLRDANSVNGPTLLNSAAVKTLDLRIQNDEILQLSVITETNQMFVNSSTLKELRPPRIPTNSSSLARDKNFVDELEEERQCSLDESNLTKTVTTDFSPDDDGAVSSVDSAIGTVRSIEAATRQRQISAGSSVLAQSMSSSCCLNEKSNVPEISTNEVVKKSTTDINKTGGQRRGSGAENMAIKNAKPRTRSTTRQTSQNQKDEKGLTNRAPSVEFINMPNSLGPIPRPKTLKSDVTTRRHGSNPVTPIEDKPPIRVPAKRSGSVDLSSAYVTEKHDSLMELLKNRIQECKRINGLLKLGNREDDALDESIRMKGMHVFARLLKAYREHPSGYSLQFAARVLPALRGLLTHRNAEYIELALSTLSTILDEFGEPIKLALASNGTSIGVDLAAEQRHASCSTCKQALTELYLNASFITSRLDQSQKDAFNSLMPMIESMIDV
ncbi:WD-REPEATS-REGION domain-containing protein [Aphelenchoides besseyi]|nr:WD-REPEATS-REGION domain-containing protein [Aphelenchoides besseyi]KAI6208210.1 WD-REPEATS-REGION domain-containing protein [Aphelenchoides besseyi]